jgi:hypothetical protein
MIILSIVLLVALYYLYIFLLGGSNGVNIMRISAMPQTPAYDIKTNTNPGSYRYSYAIWVHVKNLANITLTNKYGDQNPANNIMYLTDKPKTEGGQTFPFFSLDLYGDTSLYVRYNQPTASDPNAILAQPYLVTPNFPLQKWTLIIVSFDNKVMDLYLDGKLVKSKTMDVLPSPQTTKATMNFGTGDIDIYNYARYSYPMDPQTAWSIYQAGTPSGASMDSYGLNLNIKKDNVPWGSWGKIPLF